jgi:hypothetical protein
MNGVMGYGFTGLIKEPSQWNEMFTMITAHQFLISRGRNGNLPKQKLPLLLLKHLPTHTPSLLRHPMTLHKTYLLKQNQIWTSQKPQK